MMVVAQPKQTGKSKFDPSVYEYARSFWEQAEVNLRRGVNIRLS